MIEQARIDHLPFIQKRLAPFKRVSEETLVRVLDNPLDVTWVNPKREIVCRIRHNEKKQTNHVAWLLPADEEPRNLYLALARTLIDVSERFPEDDHFTTWARFKDKRGCVSIFTQNKMARKITAGFHAMFPNSSHVKWRIWDNSWIIYGNHGEIVKDILTYLNKPKEEVRDTALYLQ